MARPVTGTGGLKHHQPGHADNGLGMVHFLFTMAISAGDCRPADVMITLDISGTMKETTGSPAVTKYKRAKDAIDSVLTVYEDDADFGLFVFPTPAVLQSGGDQEWSNPYDDGLEPYTGLCNVSTELAVDFQPGARSAIMGYLNGITPSGKNDTPIYQALVETSMPWHWLNGDRRRRDVILLTDGIQDCCRGPFPDSPFEDNDCGSNGPGFLDANEALKNRNATIQLAYEMKSEGYNVWVVGFGNKVDPLMLSGVAYAFGTSPNLAGCDPYDSSTASSCYYNIDAGDTIALTQALQSILQQIQVEVCNGVDDDCDGEIDEDLTRTCNASCGPGGTQTCAMGEWSMCTAQAIAEVCDGQDNDCDGLIDEVSCQTACNTPGTRKCVGGMLSDTCVPKMPVQLVELCTNNNDDNCNGQVNEGCECQPNETQACSLGPKCPGEKSCRLGRWSACKATAPGEEVCNGADDDCNGQIDDGVGLCPKGSRCVQGECVSGMQVQEIGDEVPNDLEVYRGSGFVKGCNSATPPAWILLLLPLLRRRRLV